MIELKEYQERAVIKLKDQVNELLSRGTRETIVFKSPTGSGKTVMIAEFIRKLVDKREDDKQLAFIWTAPRQLHNQSKEKLDKYYSTTRSIECKFFESFRKAIYHKCNISKLHWRYNHLYHFINFIW